MPVLDLGRFDRLSLNGRAIAECGHAGRIVWSDGLPEAVPGEGL